MGVLVGVVRASASEVEPADRFEWFCETLSSDLMPLAVSTHRRAGFLAEIMSVELGTVQVSSFAYSPVRARRTSAHVRQGDPEQYQLALITEGVLRTSQHGHESFATGDLVLTDTSRPMENISGCDGGQAGVIMLQIPRSALPLRSDRVDRLLAHRIPTVGGTGAILARFLETLLEQAPRCRPEELPGLGTITLDLATACIAQHMGSLAEAPAEARARAMLQRISTFIEHNLADPALTPQAIADHHQISLRSLYVLFRDQPVSIAACIRQRRLARCHADLASADLSSHPVEAIAARWGFFNASAFSRAFREAYGITPTEHRAQALHT
ncbi:helix-turn-helix domain-containing protein [Streptomyces sp. NBC_01565]|uniref:AraC-like ligand-binding domain-containing protein n=1 Tax=unclassified Streptomyces TaxID=2593676 RepID=UPI00225BF7BB|nr:helix-turn-helix domain-containing protein [Streptomyces sp. NBC_01565]MCX4539099.1 helix-turn-helix domain-containing protein [Streptomyces sp. NBC_01565]